MTESADLQNLGVALVQYYGRYSNEMRSLSDADKLYLTHIATKMRAEIGDNACSSALESMLEKDRTFGEIDFDSYSFSRGTLESYEQQAVEALKNSPEYLFDIGMVAGEAEQVEEYFLKRGFDANMFEKSEERWVVKIRKKN